MSAKRLKRYIWERSSWPELKWDAHSLLAPLSWATESRGKLFAKLDTIGFAIEQRIETIVDEVVTTSAIEGERLERDEVRSSVARKLGLNYAGLPNPSRRVEGIVEMMLDATINHSRPLTAKRLRGWQAALFPTGYSGISEISVGKWRSESMRVVSGHAGNENIHFEAPPAKAVSAEMKAFISWWNGPSRKLPGMVRAAVAHLRFETIHPFEDGNGRVGRALVDMALAEDEQQPSRFYSVSAQMYEERSSYYKEIERAQTGDGDITKWIGWFLGCVHRAVERSHNLLQIAFVKQEFWRKIGNELNDRQSKVINRLLDDGPAGFEGGLTNRKYRSMTKAAPATATRDLAELSSLGIILKVGQGRSVKYELNWRLVNGEGDK